MSFKIGDKVKMSRDGFLFYSNLETAFQINTTSEAMDSTKFERTICALFSIHGVGTIKKINSYGDLYIRWDYRLDGIKYYSEDYYQQEELNKINFLDKIKFKIQGRI